MIITFAYDISFCGIVFFPFRVSFVHCSQTHHAVCSFPLSHFVVFNKCILIEINTIIRLCAMQFFFDCIKIRQFARSHAVEWHGIVRCVCLWWCEWNAFAVPSHLLQSSDQSAVSRNIISPNSTCAPHTFYYAIINSCYWLSFHSSRNKTSYLHGRISHHPPFAIPLWPSAHTTNWLQFRFECGNVYESSGEWCMSDFTSAYNLDFIVRESILFSFSCATPKNFIFWCNPIYYFIFSWDNDNVLQEYSIGLTF